MMIVPFLPLTARLLIRILQSASASDDPTIILLPLAVAWQTDIISITYFCSFLFEFIVFNTLGFGYSWHRRVVRAVFIL